MKILHLNVRKRWFDMIASGEKKEEYREMSEYWWRRLYDDFGIVKKFDVIEFRNGYRKDAPRIRVVHLATWADRHGRAEWGAPAGRVFIIMLGKRITAYVEEAQNEVPCAAAACKFFDSGNFMNCARGDGDDNHIPCEYCADYVPQTCGGGE